MKYDLSFLELELRKLLKKLKKHNTYASQLENEIRLYALENAKLKEKNEELRALYESEREVKEEYKAKVNKAIEYIDTWGYDEYDLVRIDENNPNFTTGEDVFTIVETLKKILKGVDKE